MAQFHEHDLVANKFMDKKAHGQKCYKNQSYKTEEALFAAIGFGEIGAITIFNRLTEDERGKKNGLRHAQKPKSWSKVARSS